MPVGSKQCGTVLSLVCTLAACGGSGTAPQDATVSHDVGINDDATVVLDLTSQDLALGDGDVLDLTSSKPDSGPSDVPAPAAAVGYTMETFNSTKIASGGWLPFSFFGVKEKATSYEQNSDGSILITGDSGDPYNADLATAGADKASAEGWTGTAFGGGAYFEAEFSFTGTPQGYKVQGWPAFWADDIESISGGYASEIQWPGQAAGYVRTVEVDFIEALVASATEYGAGTHDWYGPTKTHGDLAQSNNPVSIGTQKFSSLNKYGCLWVPATATAQGYIKFFFNRVQLGKTIVWNKYDAALPPPPVAGTSAMSVLDTRHLVPILGVANTKLPMTITNVVVWQATKANNLVH